MTDIYGHITVTDINTGKILPSDESSVDRLTQAYMIGYNWQAQQFNNEIDSWNSEFDKTHPNHGDLTDNDEYNQFIMDRWQPIIDQFNELMSVVGKAQFAIEDFAVVMYDGFGHKVGMNLVIE